MSPDLDPARVLFPLMPVIDESLLGLLARTTAWNYLERPSVILRRAGVERGSDLSNAIAARLTEVAICLGVPEASLAERMMCGPPGPSNEACYFGLKIRRFHLVHNRRRISPKALRKSPYHRAAWMIASLPFCAESWEHLIDRCPACHGALGWRVPCGLEFCEHCEFDLRYATADSVPIDCRPALSVLGAVLSPIESLRREARMSLPLRFQTLKPATVLELTLAVSRAIIEDQAERRRASIRGGLTPTELAEGMRMVLQFPKSFAAIADVHRSENTARSPFFKRLSAANQSAGNPELQSLVSAIADEFEPIRHGPGRLKALREELGRMTTRMAARELGVDNATIRKLINAHVFSSSKVRGDQRQAQWLLPGDVSQAAGWLKNRISPNEFHERFGLPVSGIEQLISLGLLQALSNPAVQAIYPDLQLDRSTAEEFALRFGAALPHENPGDDALALADAFNAIGATEKPWGAIIHAALRRELPEHLTWFRSHSFRFDAMRVSWRFARDLANGRYPELLLIPPRPESLGPPLDFNRVEVQRYLNCFPRDVAWLIAEGRLSPANGTGRTIPRAQVEGLGRALISSREISWRWRISPTLREALPSRHGIQRTLGPFWPREAVTEFFEQTFPIGQPKARDGRRPEVLLRPS